MSEYLLIDNLPRDKEYPKYKALGKISRLVKWCMDNNNPILASILDRQRKLSVGDMIVFRDELVENGFILWKDFTIKKLEEK